MTGHVFEFIALECVRQNELGGDEVYVRLGSQKVFPSGRGLVEFVTGGVLVNRRAHVPQTTILELSGRRGARDLGDDPAADQLRQAKIPQHGLLVEIMEHDLWTRHDRLGRILVSQKPTGGPVLHVFDTVAGHYRLTYQVLAERDEEALAEEA